MTRPAGVITLTGLRAYGHHGVFERERRDGQEFLVDVRLWLDITPAARSDDLADTVDYGALADRIVELVAGPPVALLETLATRLVDAVLAIDGRIGECEVTVHKPGAPIPHRFADVAVTAGGGRDSLGAHHRTDRGSDDNGSEGNGGQHGRDGDD